ncbi:hypothetical protein GYMLUDRAFT_32334 [Collybiopsis luxurians FD-317 M1]|nr:hypothetical protein GYMLUDRAFT_32334 [Collybiopsis luxurians FD-317 M1]
MNSRTFHSHRSTEAPMDFQFTSRPNTTPAWKVDDENPSTPRKSLRGIVFSVWHC